MKGEVIIRYLKKKILIMILSLTVIKWRLKEGIEVYFVVIFEDQKENVNVSCLQKLKKKDQVRTCDITGDLIISKGSLLRFSAKAKHRNKYEY